MTELAVFVSIQIVVVVVVIVDVSVEAAPECIVSYTIHAPTKSWHAPLSVAMRLL